MPTDLSFLGDKVSVSIGDDLIPKCTIKKYTDNVRVERIPIGFSDEEMKEFTREKTIRELKKREEDFTNGVDLFKDFRYIDIEQIQKTANGWNYFDKPETYELLNLISSIESLGIITPLIVKTRDNETFTIINGNSRYLALTNICKYKNEERFRKIPCFVVDEDIDEYFERSLMIDANINYRKISKEVYIKAILEKHTMLKETKSYRGEFNIAEKISNDLSISDATVFNYLTLKKLCPDAMALVYEKKLKLQPARMLAKLSHEN
ncbi:MAG: ParB/RepB/Spo0J family partition protein, partial [Oscillospiraceae bacterium]|nr:ParB/RepB/Spo0J family partition protein [Oscillospiraceae bacterium]